jgi:hypothetical protein
VRFRPGHLALIAFQIVWLNVILPGHTRGIVTLPDGSGSMHGSCCPTAPAGKQDQPTERDKQNCAVCFFAARVTPAPAPDIYLPRLGYVETLEIPRPEKAMIAALPASYHGRAPPVC